MKWSQLLVPTSKEIPGDAEIPSHQLMLRAGMIRRIASGTYAYLPMGLKVLQQIQNIIREEMNATGAQEVLMPAIQPIELWKKTGRDRDYGETLGTFVDRHGRTNVLAPTAEEVFTFIGSNEINSYKQLPINLYQISFKYRDEFRPRFGVLRSREFIMKDAYSFHDSDESLHETYMTMYDSYCKIFQRCGVQYVIVEAESGEMGGSASHQFTIPCETGEDVIVYAEKSKYAANIEKASVDPLPKSAPIAAGDIAEISTPNVGSIDGVCKLLNCASNTLIKTLLFWEEDNEQLDGMTTKPESVRKKIKIVAVLLRGDHEVNPEKLKIEHGCKLALLPEAMVTFITHSGVGFAGPVDIINKVDKLIIDHGVAGMGVGITGANKTDTHLKNVVPGRDFPIEGDNVIVGDIRNAVQGDTKDGETLLFKRGIEVGQVFKLGDKYAKQLDATYLGHDGKPHTLLMGCYGIGVNRIMASAIELYHDDWGIVWPISIAPYEVLVTCVNHNDEEVVATSEAIYNQLLEQGIDVILDDRPLRGGFKFKDADLVGIPIRVTVGKKTLANGNVEIKFRRDKDGQEITVAEAVIKTQEYVNQLYTEIEGSS
jgi:prolyl-tRNA synthetase